MRSNIIDDTFTMLLLLISGLGQCLKYLLLIICVPHAHSSVLDSEFCEASQSTRTEVLNCPTDKMKWREAAEMKNCSHYEHACKGKLSYHCVINPWQNATVEVCAPETQINAGYCAEYNRRGGKIQEFYKKSCENCVNEYISTEAYKYQECYREVYKLRANKTKDMFKSNRILDSNNATQAMQEKDGSEQAFPSIGNYTGGHSFHVILLVCFLFVCLC